MDAQWWDALLRQSLERATPFTREVFGARSLTGQEVVAFLQRARIAVVGTTNAAGAPHLSLTGLTVWQGRVFVGFSPQAAAFRHLQRSPRVALVAHQGWRRVLILEGEARILPDGEEAQQVRQAEQARHGWASPVIVEVLPRKAFSWKGEEAS
ncbi:MAG: pyridoxamine 5'-phosphate oxidase family protein [Dehalococcoidia bacterium]|nr:pyridoxamine 5'-phosphate oxidase family protein [Dehalococcoidia bacterium]MDW8120192.1 pyridoxamine 5'-phosphate oxidase family protein [Chloroflexota bacterium]